ncbi:fructosamine kinase [Prauserella marina]|uniref:Fructosamine-3-kinase n=1 Tax=Prauserella marina TaxID=530584 RepID=A0A222VKB3_9PSEU|nr:fructosamine kinase family protein [Prauserella marina]ASR34366.1 fructosamine kinase [Prauserella marina]PWV71842.1 fructosamine-3-kinase [Prauserella marina]SDD89124.1 Fructosamine-3-kinase [Prauserella marina]
MTDKPALRAVERHLAAKPVHTFGLGGTAVVVSLDGGGQVVAKRGAGKGATAAEAAGLRWLGEYGDVPVPAVHGYDEEWLVTEYVAPGIPGTSAAERLGRGLAALHLRGAPSHGCPPPGGPADAWMGLAPMRDEPRADWPASYATDRIEPYVRSCVDKGRLTLADAKVFDEVCVELPRLAGPPEPPARLHGDAWSGNVHWAEDGSAWLIDPAAHGGHRETDLAMLRLFGTPLLDHIVGGYEEAARDAGAPLADGWRERVPLHQLFPLLVHAVLFGEGYARQALTAARACLG